MLARSVVFGVIALAGVAVAADAADIDARALYVDKCAKCHFESGADMANLKMSYKGPVMVVNSTGKTVESLLKNHHKVRMTQAETVAMMELFRRGLTWEAVYREKCESCHGAAITFAREKLVLNADTAYAPARNATVRDVLGQHGGATAAEADVLADMLRYQIGEAQ